jgi:hypothetical protein
VPEHLEWLVVNDPRVRRNGKIIRRYTGPEDVHDALLERAAEGERIRDQLR